MTGSSAASFAGPAALTPQEEVPLLPGSPVALDDAARALAGRAGALETAAEHVARVRAALAGTRTTAATAAAERLGEASDGARGLARLLRAAAEVIAGFGARLAGLQAAASAAAGRHAEAVARRGRWTAQEHDLDAQVRLAELGHPGLPTSGPPGTGTLAGPTAWHLHELRRQRAAARRERERAEADAHAAVAEHRSAADQHRDAARTAALQLAALADTRAVRAWALGGGGGTAESFLASRNAGLAGAALLARLAAASPQDGPVAGTGLGDTLARVLHEAGADPVFWSAFWSATRPDDVYRAAARYVPAGARYGLGAYQEEWASLLGALGAGTAAWALTRTPAERLAFGRRAARGLVVEPESAPEVLAAMLGAAPQPVPRPLGLPSATPTTGPGGATRNDRDAALADVATGVLAALDDRPGEVDPLDAPAAAAALGALSRDPAAALSYLAAESPAVLDARVDRWLGSSVVWPDGGEGATAAFATAALAGAFSSSRAEQARGAQLVSRATTVLPGGLLHGNRVLSPAAEANVARAYHVHLGTAGDLSARTELTGEIAPASAAQSADVAGRPGTRPDVPLSPGLGSMPQPVQADLDLFRLREVIARTSSTAEGAAGWLTEAASHHAAVLDHVFPADGGPPPASAGITDRLDHTAAVRDSLRDVGAVAGALQVEELRRAEGVEAQREVVVDVIGTVVAAPVAAGAGAVAGAAARRVASEAVAQVTTAAAQAAADQGVGAAGDLLTELTGHEVWDARRRIALTGDALRGPFIDQAHDAAVAWSVAGGATPAEAEAAWEHLAPGHVEAAEPFDRAYEKAAHPDTGVDPATGERLDPEERP